MSKYKISLPKNRRKLKSDFHSQSLSLNDSRNSKNLNPIERNLGVKTSFSQSQKTVAKLEREARRAEKAIYEAEREKISAKAVQERIRSSASERQQAELKNK